MTDEDTSEKVLGETLEDVPVSPRFPGRIDRRAQGMNERVHIAGVEVVFLVPGRGRQHDSRNTCRWCT